MTALYIWSSDLLPLLVYLDRNHSLATEETKEGISYLTGCDLQQTSDIKEIPAPVKVHNYDHLSSKELSNSAEVYFHLETIGLGKAS